MSKQLGVAYHFVRFFASWLSLPERSLNFAKGGFFLLIFLPFEQISITHSN